MTHEAPSDHLVQRLRSVDVSWSETGEWCAEAADRITQLEAEVARLRRNVKGWVEWHRRCDADDDCTHLNDNAWCDAEALASTGMGLIARAALKDTAHD